MTTREERIAGGLLGLLVGDALGVPYEFHAPHAIPPADQIDMAPPADFRRSHPAVPPGTWSDDGAQALCLLASLLHAGRLDLDDFSSRLLNWWRHGYMAVQGQVFDIGIQTVAAFRRLEQKIPPARSGPSEERHNGNGSLMRVLPLALWHQGSDAELVRDAHAQSQVTHGHVQSKVCCAIYCLWARRLLQGAGDPWSSAVEALRGMSPKGSDEREALESQVRPDDAPQGSGGGYVVDTLHSARMLAALPYEAAVRGAILLGNDTDTTACVTGGIVGVREGADAIPKRWREALRGGELFTPLLDRLLDHA